MLARAKTVLIGSLIVLGPHVALAQTDAVANVQKRVLTLAGARLVANAAETEAKRLNTTGAVAVVDDGGNLLYLLRIDNTFPAGSVRGHGQGADGSDLPDAHAQPRGCSEKRPDVARRGRGDDAAGRRCPDCH